MYSVYTVYLYDSVTFLATIAKLLASNFDDRKLPTCWKAGAGVV